MTIEVYIRGDLVESTGNSEVCHGAVFHEYLIQEGHRKGEVTWNMRAPDETLAQFYARQNEQDRKQQESITGQPHITGT